MPSMISRPLPFAQQVRRGIARSSGGAPSPPHPRLQAPGLAVRARAKPVGKWEENRWVQRRGMLPGGIAANVYDGFYQTVRGHKLRGLILESERGVEPYITKPPLGEIDQHTGHKACFIPKNDMFFVHLTYPPKSVDEAIVNTEVLLSEVEKEAAWPRRLVQPLLRAISRAGVR